MFRHGLTQAFQKFKIGIVGAPINLGQPKLGVSEGPTLVRNTGLIQRLEELGHDVIDAGDVLPDDDIPAEYGPSGERNHNSVLYYNQKLANTVTKIINDERLCVTIGGDHSASVGTIAGHSKAVPHKQLIVLWVDAHPDINTGRTSNTGNMHGMAISFLLKEMRNKVNRLPGCDWPQPSFEAKHLAYIGLRDVDVLEQKFLDDLGILHLGMKDVDKYGLHECMARCLDQLQPNESRSLHVSFDIDALDPSEAPSTGTLVRGGLTLREGLSIVESAHHTGCLRGFDLMEFNPTVGSNADINYTAQAAKFVILSAAAGFF